MAVMICPSEDEDGCERCPCDVGDYSKYNFGDWLHYNCDDLQGSYMRLTNEEGRTELVISEVEAFGKIIPK